MQQVFPTGRKQAIVRGMRLIELCEDAARVIPDPGVRNMVQTVAADVERELSRVAGRSIRLELLDPPPDEPLRAPEPDQDRAIDRNAIASHPLVERVRATFDARITDVRPKPNRR